MAWDGRVSDLVFVDDLQIKGGHNQQNALAAAACALVLGATDTAVGEGLLTFRPLEHRIEPAGLVDGVACYNDSKATNVDATLVALTAFLPTRPIVLLGGRDKGTDLAPLVAACEENARAVVCFGEAASGSWRLSRARGSPQCSPPARWEEALGCGSFHRRGRGRGRALAGLRLLRRV